MNLNSYYLPLPLHLSLPLSLPLSLSLSLPLSQGMKTDGLIYPGEL